MESSGGNSITNLRDDDGAKEDQEQGSASDQETDVEGEMMTQEVLIELMMSARYLLPPEDEVNKMMQNAMMLDAEAIKTKLIETPAAEQALPMIREAMDGMDDHDATEVILTCLEEYYPVTMADIVKDERATDLVLDVLKLCLEEIHG